MPSVFAASRTSAVAHARTRYPTLKKGSRGPAVVELQNKLRAAGFSAGGSDGSFGPRTDAAVKAFQRARGLTVDGVVGPKTWGVLNGAASTPPPPAASGGSGPTLRLGVSGEPVKVLQNRLTQLGFNTYGADGRFGPKTEAAVKAFQRARGLTVDGVVGPKTWNALGVSASGQVSSGGGTPVSSAGEPAHNYTRIGFRGVAVNVRTRQMIENAEAIGRKLGAPMPLRLTQGSYSNSVSASAGTHNGGGALDISVRGYSRSQILNMVKALRMAGFAAWSRGNNDGMPPHIHAIAIGDRQSSSAAKSQVSEFFRGGDGLRGSRPDFDASVGRPVPAWANAYR